MKLQCRRTGQTPSEQAFLAFSNLDIMESHPSLQPWEREAALSVVLVAASELSLLCRLFLQHVGATQRSRAASTLPYLGIFNNLII